MITPDRRIVSLIQSEQLWPLIALAGFSLVCNLPLGYLRAFARRFSLRWFILVHLSIPFLVILRTMLGFSWYWIPLTIGCAVAGQIIGAQFAKRAGV